MINDVDPTHRNFWIRLYFHYFKVNIFHYAFMIIMIILKLKKKIHDTINDNLVKMPLFSVHLYIFLNLGEIIKRVTHCRKDGYSFVQNVNV